MPTLYGREHELQAFREAVARAGRERREVAVFYGPGGQGKTQLCAAIVESIAGNRDASARHPHCLIDFKAHSTSAPEALYAIRTALIARAHFQRPLFDIAFKLFQERFNPGIDTRKRYPEMFLESKTSSGSNDIVDTLLELVSATATHIPFVTLVEKYSRRLADHIGHARTRRLREELAGIEMWSGDDWHYQLPALLAKDISELAAEGECPVVLFDHYEHLWEGGREGSDLSPAADRWVRVFCENLSRGVCAIFSRERLDRWIEPGGSWQPDDIRHVALSNLSARDAIRMLKAANVTARPIRKRVVGLAGGHPLFLQVQIETYRAALRAGKTPRLEDFGVSKKDVISRFVDHLDPRDGLCLKVLAIPNSFDRSAFDYLADRLPNAFYGLTFDAVSGYSFFQARDDGWLVMHSVMRSGLEALCDARTKRRAHEAIFEYADQRWREAIGKDAPTALRFWKSAARHRLQYDDRGFLAWVLALPEQYLGKDFHPEIEQARQVAQRLALHEDELECLWRLSFDDSDRRLQALDRAAALIDLKPETWTEKQMLVRVRRIDAMLSADKPPQAIVAACAAAAGNRDGVATLGPEWRAHFYWCWARACYQAEDDEGYRTHLEESLRQMPGVLGSAFLQFHWLVYELLNCYKQAGEFERIRRVAGDASRRIASEAGPLRNPQATKLAMELAARIGDRPLPDQGIEALRDRIVEELGVLASSSDEALAARVAIPPHGESRDNLTGLAPIFRGGNIGLVVNARGKMCLVLDFSFPVVIGNYFHVRYDARRRRVYLCLNRAFVYEVDWQATEEMHDYMLRIDRILVIRVAENKPVEGYDCGFLVCNGPGEASSAAGGGAGQP